MDDPAERIGRAMSWFASEDEPDDERDEPEVMGPILDEPELMREMIAAALERDPLVAHLAGPVRSGTVRKDQWPRIIVWLERQS